MSTAIRDTVRIFVNSVSFYGLSDPDPYFEWGSGPEGVPAPVLIN
jgi:hypothetical protein